MANWHRVARRRRFYKRRKGVKFTLPSSRSKNIFTMAKLAFFGVILLFLSTFLIFPLMAFDLPNPDKIVRREGFSTKILDRNGELLYDIYADQRRTPVELKDIPEDLRDATIAIEDKNFYKHQGFDPLGMLRGISRIATRGRAQGGSTLTQQLVKNVLLTPERSIFRKIREFILAVQIERSYSKDQILQMYLNEAPYGGTAWGVEAAAETYFDKRVSELTLLESAVLAGFPQRPSFYSPYSSNPDAYIGRTTDVLRRMREDGYINEEEEKNALAELEEIEFAGKGVDFKAPHFVQYVQKILEERYGERVVEQGGLRVTTTLDLELQEKAQEIIAEEIAKVEGLHITNGAAVVMDPETGEILAMVGSKRFDDPNYDGQVNVTLSLRQPGSAIKPITYATGLKEGKTASTLILDVATTFPGGAGQPPYEPVNYDGKFRGPLQARYTLANSINVPAVKMLAMVGIRDMLQTAYDLGINSLEPTNDTLSRVGLSVTLGGGEVRLLELTGAYAAFMNGGFKVEPISILKVEDSKGKVLEEVNPKKGKQVISEEIAFIISDILADNEARSMVFGTNSLLNIPGRKVAVKTGTTNDKRDNWTIGGNPTALVGVWVGNNDNSQMREVASGVSGASPIWRSILLASFEGKANKTFEEPKGVVTAAVDSVSGFAAHDGYPSRIEYFVKGTEPREDPVHVKLKVCKSDGRLATPADISSGNYEEKEYFIFKEEDPTAAPGGENMWQKGILEWLSTQGDSRYHPPSDYCGTSNPVSVEIKNPGDHASNIPNKFNVEIRAESVNEIVEVRLYVDGNRVRTFTGPPYSYELELANGIYKIKAVAKDEKGNESEREITVGVGMEWNYSPSPIPTQTLTPSPTPTIGI